MVLSMASLGRPLEEVVSMLTLPTASLSTTNETSFALLDELFSMTTSEDDEVMSSFVVSEVVVETVLTSEGIVAEVSATSVICITLTHGIVYMIKDMHG